MADQILLDLSCISSTMWGYNEVAASGVVFSMCPVKLSCSQEGNRAAHGMPPEVACRGGVG